MKVVPKLDKSASGQMVLGKVKLTRGANDLESANSMDLQSGTTSVPYTSSLSSSPQCLCCACSLQIQQFLHQEPPAALNCHFLEDTPESLDDDGGGGGCQRVTGDENDDDDEDIDDDDDDGGCGEAPPAQSKQQFPQRLRHMFPFLEASHAFESAEMIMLLSLTATF